MPELSLNQQEQELLEQLFKMPPEFESAKMMIQDSKMDGGSITKVGLRYAEECHCDYGEHLFATEDHVTLSEVRPDGILPDLHSTYIHDVVRFLLQYGLDPNAVYEVENHQYNMMELMLGIENEYLAADTMVLLMEHGGDPNLVVNGESIFEQYDTEVWFGSVEQLIRYRYDAWIHTWMVLVAYGGDIKGKGPGVTLFREYDSSVMFDLKKLKNHREYYFGLSIENNERTLHIYDKQTFWKVAEW